MTQVLGFSKRVFVGRILLFWTEKAGAFIFDIEKMKHEARNRAA